MFHLLDLDYLPHNHSTVLFAVLFCDFSQTIAIGRIL